MPVGAELLEKVNHALEDIRPHLLMDGNIELIEITDDLTVKNKMVSTEFCSMSTMTMKAGERTSHS